MSITPKSWRPFTKEDVDVVINIIERYGLGNGKLLVTQEKIQTDQEPKEVKKLLKVAGPDATATSHADLEKAFTLHGNFTMCCVRVRGGGDVGIGAAKLNMEDVRTIKILDPVTQEPTGRTKTVINNPRMGSAYALVRAVKNYLDIPENGVSHGHFKLDRKRKQRRSVPPKATPEGTGPTGTNAPPTGNPAKEAAAIGPQSTGKSRVRPEGGLPGDQVSVEELTA